MVLKDLNGPTWDVAVPNSDPVWHSTNIAWLTLSIWIICSHLAKIVLILGKDRLRQQPKNLLIINVALTNLLLGVFVVPALIHVNVSWIQVTSQVSCELRVVLMAFNHHVQPTVAMLSVLSVAVERLVHVLMLSKRKKITRRFTLVTTAVYAVLPWLLTAAVTVPLFMAGLGEKATEGSDCQYQIHPPYFIVAHVLCYVVPSIALIVVTKWLGLFDCVKTRGGSELSASLSALRRESLIVVAITGTISILFEMPFFIVRLLMLHYQCADIYCTHFFEALETSMWLRIVKAAIFPFLWLAYWDARAVIMNFPECTKEMEDEEPEEDSPADVSYSDYPTLETRPLRSVDM